MMFGMATPFVVGYFDHSTERPAWRVDTSCDRPQPVAGRPGGCLRCRGRVHLADPVQPVGPGPQRHRGAVLDYLRLRDVRLGRRDVRRVAHYQVDSRGQQGVDHVRADEPGTAGDQDPHVPPERRPTQPRTTTVPAALSCRPRLSQSQISAGTKSTSSAVRTKTASGVGGVSRGSATTRSDSARIPALCPATVIRTRYSTTNTTRLQLPGTLERTSTLATR